MDIKTLIKERLTSHFSDDDRHKIYVSLVGIKRSIKRIEEIVNHISQLSISHALDYIFYLNIDTVKQQQTEKAIVSCYFCFSPLCHQMKYVGEAFQDSSHYDFIALVDLSEINKQSSNTADDFSDFKFISLPNERSLQKIDFIQAIFLPEQNERAYWPIPTSVIRIGCPHGIDVSLIRTVNDYVGAILFDYIITPIPIPSIPNDEFIDQYPKCLINHTNDELCAIPFGSAKLDSLHNASLKKNTDNIRIIYHLSLWRLEKKVMRNQINKTLSYLCDAFPEAEIIFRPFPSDINQPELSAQLKSIQQYDNFSISTASSYVDEYAEADLLVTSIMQTGTNFAIATGRPIFCLDYEETKSGTQKTDLGLQIGSIEELIKQIKKHLKNTTILSNRISEYSKKSTLNLGHSMDYLLDNFHFILSGQKNSNWQYFTLHSDTFNLLTQNEQIERSLQQKMNSPYNWIALANAAINHCPTNAKFHFYATHSYTKTPNPFEYNFFFYFWYKALKHAVKSIALTHDEDLLIDIFNWLHSKGFYIAQSVKFFIHSGSHSYGDDIDELIESLFSQEKLNKLFNCGSIRELARPSNKITQAHLSYIKKIMANSNSDIHLFGAGEIAMSFIDITKNDMRFEIKQVYDSNVEKKGMPFSTYTIQNIKDCNDLITPFLICSIDYADDMEETLYSLYGNKITVINLKYAS